MNTEGKACIINADGTGFRIPEFSRPNEFGWGASSFFKDGRRVILMSLEKENWGGRSFYEYYHKIHTHIWAYDLDSGSLTELATKRRIENFYSPGSLLPGEERMIVQVITENGKARLFSMDLDGGNPRQITDFSDGFPYGANVSPDGKRLAFHLAGPSPHSYRVFTSDLDGKDRKLIAGEPDHLYFGYDWSPGGDWILFQDCLHRQDPGHDWSDVCIARPDGSELKRLTTGQLQWFGASWGPKANPGGGSNMPKWAPNGKEILFSRRLPDSKTPWEIQPRRKDTDHFNRDYKPDAARGGAVLSCLRIKDGSVRTLTRLKTPQWEMYPDWSADGKQVAFCRAEVGGNPGVYAIQSDGNKERLLSRGLNENGATHPRWLP